MKGPERGDFRKRALQSWSFLGVLDSSRISSKGTGRSSALCVTLHFTISGGSSSPTDFTTAVTTALVLPLCRAQPGSASSEKSSSGDSQRSKSKSNVALYLSNPRGRASPTDFTTAVTLTLVVCWTKKAQLRQKTQRIRLRPGTGLCDSRTLSYISRFYDCSGCRGPVHCKFGRSSVTTFRLCDCCNDSCDTVFCNLRRPSYTNRIFGTRRPIFTRQHCNIGFCRGTVHRDLRRLSFTHRLCGFHSLHHDVLRNALQKEIGLCRVICDPRRLGFTDRLCEFDRLLHDALRNAGSPSGPRGGPMLRPIMPLWWAHCAYTGTVDANSPRRIDMTP